MRRTVLVTFCLSPLMFSATAAMAAEERDKSFLRKAPATVQETEPVRQSTTPQRISPQQTPQRASPQTLQRLSPSAIRRVSGQPSLSTEAIKDVPYVMPQRAVGTLQMQPSGPQAMQRMATPTYDLFYLADDLKPGERYYVGKTIHSTSGSQQWGYDVGVLKSQGSGKAWRETKTNMDWNDPKNSDYHVYGKPVYAVGPGTIIRCWRNAPENPRPFSSALGDDFDEDFEDRDWLHPMWRAKRMSGGGNHLLVEEDDGDLILYAHAQPGSIPQALCPHNAQLFTMADATSQADVPEAQQVRIEAGQFLYRTGNSGNSSAPHLHIHLQDADGNPKQFKFRRGLSSPAIDKKVDINKWTRFAGKRIPDGPVAIWPPRRLTGEYARHGFPASSFQRMFDHLADSGFWPVWIDGYSVGGKGYLNYVWRPSKGNWRAFFLVTPSKYQSEFTKATNDGYAPVFVDGSTVGGKPRYTVIFVKNKPGGWLARHGLNYQQHMAVMDEAKSKNLYPANISVMSVDGNRSYTVLWRSENLGAWTVKSRVAVPDYQALYNAQGQAGKKPSYANAYMHKGKGYYTVVFSTQPNGPRKDRHGLTPQQYQTEFNSALQANLLTRIVSGYDGAQKNHRYIATWRK
ncbi:MAG: hypothetical protein ACE363_05575 [Alphaproteobacteria bacterium]